MDKTNKEYTIIYFFESEFKGLKSKWFYNKEEAYSFVRTLYSCTDEDIEDDDLPLYKHKFYLNSEDICDWLNRDLILF
jgi:protein involved in sex pheromone biosynthesis